jgi:hypothetical protein
MFNLEQKTCQNFDEEKPGFHFSFFTTNICPFCNEVYIFSEKLQILITRLLLKELLGCVNMSKTFLVHIRSLFYVRKFSGASSKS